MRTNPILRVATVLVMALVVWFLRSQPNAATSNQTNPSQTNSGQTNSGTATSSQTSSRTASQTNPSATTSNPTTLSLIVKNQTIYDLDGRVAYHGDVDLRPTLARIQSGQRDQHRNDGMIHRNREGKLPRQPDPEYYREYVVRTPGLRSVGPQRLIVGKGGEAYYTPDHFQNFVRVK